MKSAHWSVGKKKCFWTYPVDELFSWEYHCHTGEFANALRVGEIADMFWRQMAINEAKIAALMEEVNFIHFANVLYWKQGAECSREARAEYQRRQDRLREIRSEVLDLRFTDNN